MKKCSKCKEEKPISDFNIRNGAEGNKPSSYCKLCHQEYVKDHYVKNKEKYINNASDWSSRNPESRRKIGTNWVRRAKGNYVSEQVFKEMMDSQKNCCAICDRELTTTKLTCVDHNHVTGKIRGILCRNCNTGLGMLKDSISTLQSAAEYLKKFGGQE